MKKKKPNILPKNEQKYDKNGSEKKNRRVGIMS